MKFRVLFFILIFIILGTSGASTAFELNKISEFSKSEIYDQSNNNLVIQDNYLYSVNRRSFKIFEIQDNTISLINNFNMQGRLRYLSLKDNFAYVATGGRTSRLYRIDISNVNSPIITDTLFYLGNYANFIDGNNVFVHELLPDWTWKAHVYDNENFQEITVFNVPHEMSPIFYVSEGVGFIDDGYTSYLYNISNPDSLQLIGYYIIDEFSSPFNTTIIQDTIFIIGSGLSKLKMYNISNPFIWQLISEIDNSVSNFRISGDKIVMIGGSDKWLYDISTLTNPVLLDYDSYDFDTYSGMTIEANKVFLTRYLEGELIYYSIENDCFDEITTYKNYGWLPSIYMYDDNLYIQTYSNGIKRWNITNMSSPNFIETYNSNYLSITKLRGDGVILVQSCVKKSNFQITDFIFSINEDGSLTVLDSLVSSYYGPLAYKEGVGFFKASNYIFYKYRLNDNNELEEVATITLPVRQGEIYFYNNVAYLLAHEKFIVIKNINTDDEIEVALEINTNYISNQTVGFFQNYFFLSEENLTSDCSIFDISDPLYPTLVDTIYNNGAIGIDEENELLFMGKNICSIYDLSNIENNSINAIYSFQNWSYAQQTIPFMRNCNNYLLYLEDTSVSIYEYSTTSIDEELQQVNDIQFTNYPNPFSTSTTIFFSATNRHEQTRIKIYNIKGQIIKQFSSIGGSASGGIITDSKFLINEVVWDGKDENGKELSNGIYFYKLTTDYKTFIKKMILLR